MPPFASGRWLRQMAKANVSVDVEVEITPDDSTHFILSMTAKTAKTALIVDSVTVTEYVGL